MARKSKREGHHTLKEDESEFREYLKKHPWSVVHMEWWQSRPELHPWIRALEAIDKNDNKDPLLALLKSENDELPHAARVYLADLLERYDLKTPRGRPRTPLYNRSSADYTMSTALECVDMGKMEGLSLEESLKNEAENFRIPLDTLSKAHSHVGRLGSVNRRKKLYRP